MSDMERIFEWLSELFSVTRTKIWDKWLCVDRVPNTTPINGNGTVRGEDGEDRQPYFYRVTTVGTSK